MIAPFLSTIKAYTVLVFVISCLLESVAFVFWKEYSIVKLFFLELDLLVLIIVKLSSELTSLTAKHTPSTLALVLIVNVTVSPTVTSSTSDVNVFTYGDDAALTSSGGITPTNVVTTITKASTKLKNFFIINTSNNASIETILFIKQFRYSPICDFKSNAVVTSTLLFFCFVQSTIILLLYKAKLPSRLHFLKGFFELHLP